MKEEHLLMYALVFVLGFVVARMMRGRLVEGNVDLKVEGKVVGTCNCSENNYWINGTIPSCLIKPEYDENKKYDTKLVVLDDNDAKCHTYEGQDARTLHSYIRKLEKIDAGVASKPESANDRMVQYFRDNFPLRIDKDITYSCHRGFVLVNGECKNSDELELV